MGPLKGVKVIEMASIGPTPFCGMLLADMGADVISVGRLAVGDLGIEIESNYDFPNRNKRAVAMDLKSPEGIETFKQLVASADMLIEGFRPGVMERLGLGPEVCQEINPKLIYGRMTGWGQEGPMRMQAGHDINYIALTGALAASGYPDRPPTVALNLVGDYGGGALYLAMGLLAAYIETRNSGKGQVIDAAMVDGVANMMTMHYGYRQAGIWTIERGSNPADGGSPYYTCYETRDGKHVATGAVEKRFYAEMVQKLGLDLSSLPNRDDKACWPELHAIFAAEFKKKDRDEWARIFAEGDACVSPVLTMDEAPSDPAARERGMFKSHRGITEPMPAPRFSRTPSEIRSAPVDPKTGTQDALAAWGIDAGKIQSMANAGIIPPAGGK
ncbi:MAG: CaiB/BaiF CoA transferase family protein [Flavobacteriaceae bacterium]